VSDAPRAPMIGIFGGTFDPVHFGHLRAALETAERLGLDQVRMLPAGQPPHRDPPQAPADERLEMLRLAVAGRPEFTVDDREVRRPGPSYMVDTLRGLRAEDEAASLVLCIGQDAANALDGWRQWRRLFDLAHIAVLRRPDARGAYRGALRAEMEARRTDDPGQLRASPAGRVLTLAITQLDISSTAIRAMVAAGRSPGFLLPDAVAEHIRRRGLYC